MIQPAPTGVGWIIVKNHAGAQSATSLPAAPRDEASSRMTKYFIMMGVRVVCFVLMVLITPYGWYTWALAAGAIVLPYLAVVIANVGQDSKTADAQNPERPLMPPIATPPATTEQTGVIRIEEQPPSKPIDS